MEKSIKRWQIIGFFTTALGGTLLHFLFDWLGNSVFIAPFSGVNESTWEHMKLLFWPMFIFAVIQSFFYKERKDFWCIKLRGILLGITLIPTMFYTYNGAIGKSHDWLNIAIFFLCAAIAYIYETRRFSAKSAICKSQIAPIIMLCIVALLFVIFTFWTPKLGIFRDPITGLYGI